MRKIVLTGGGTAGHVFPLLSVVRYLQKKGDFEFLYLGEKEGVEEKIVRSKGINFEKITAGKFRPYFSWLNFFAPSLTMAGFFESLVRIARFRPEIVLAKGGYVTVPVVLAAFVLRKKIYLHESDSTMGRSNRFLAVLAKKIFVSFAIKHYPKKYREKLVFSGLPVRKEFESSHFFPKAEKLVLAFGGSRGAEKINQLVLESIPHLTPRVKLILISGEKSYEKVQLIREKMPVAIKKAFKVFAFVHEEMPSLIKKSDLIISRAGATSIFEIAAAERPVILIPYPYAAADHQTKNALLFQSAGAAVVFKEDQTEGSTFAKTVLKMVLDNEFLSELSKNIAKLKPMEAEKIIGEEIVK